MQQYLFKVSFSVFALPRIDQSSKWGVVRKGALPGRRDFSLLHHGWYHFGITLPHFNWILCSFYPWINWTPCMFGHHIPRHFKLCNFWWERYCAFQKESESSLLCLQKSNRASKVWWWKQERWWQGSHSSEGVWRGYKWQVYCIRGQKYFFCVYLHAALKISLHCVSCDCLLCP